LEDDKRPWKKQSRHLLAVTLTHAQRAELKRGQEKIDWARVAQLVGEPVGVPVPVSGSGQDTHDGGGNGLEQVIAQARLVRNTLPRDSTWDGKTDLPLSDAEFNEMMSGNDPGDSDSATSGATHDSPAPAPAPARAAGAGTGAAARPGADPAHGAAAAPAAEPNGT
jgi:hypothetical protein